MRELVLDRSDPSLVAAVEDAKRGEPSIITRHGEPEAVVISFAEWKRLSRVPSFGEFLMSAPFEEGDIPERDRRPMREVDL